MEHSEIVWRVLQDLPFLVTAKNVPRTAWNDLTLRFNPHLVNGSAAGEALDPISVFWSANPLLGIGKLALASMVAQGHPVTLYTYDDPADLRAAVPSGVRVANAEQVVARKLYEACLARTEIRYFSDIFRYAVLHQRGGWWLDTDVVIVKPLCFNADHVFSTQWSGLGGGHVCVGDVMRAPKGSPHMQRLYEAAVEVFLRGGSGKFGDVGPLMLTQYLLSADQVDLVPCILPPTHFNAIDWQEAELFVSEGRDGFDLVADHRVSGVHLWSMMWKLKKLDFDNAPPASVVGHLKRMFGSENYLDQLAQRFDSDKGAVYRGRYGHSYARIYGDLFRSMTLAPIRILELGLCRGRVEGWKQDQVPSLQMWLEYFPNAQVAGVDIEDFSWFHHPRAATYRIDQSSREMLTAFAEGEQAPFDVIIDDASHASEHQQLTLGILYQLLKPGGIYVIEDLDWQPEELEAPHAEKTKRLLRMFKLEGHFQSPVLTDWESNYIASETASVELHDSYSELLNRCLHGGLGVLRKVGRSGAGAFAGALGRSELKNVA